MSDPRDLPLGCTIAQASGESRTPLKRRHHNAPIESDEELSANATDAMAIRDTVDQLLERMDVATLFDLRRKGDFSQKLRIIKNHANDILEREK